MINRLDREMQRRILEACAADYPRPSGLGDAVGPLDDIEAEHVYVANIAYLMEHGLIDSDLKVGQDGHFSGGTPTITARGLDFITDDGGLGAILGTLTVKLHADSIKDIILQRVDAAALPAGEKSILRKHVGSLSGKALEAAVAQLAKIGMDHLPDVVQWLRTLGAL